MQQVDSIQNTSACEWSLLRIEDLGDCIGTCSCGKKWVRYYYYVKRPKAQTYACLCPDCVQMLPHIATVAGLLHVFFYGITATFVCNGENGNHIFAVNSEFSFAKRKSEIAREFNSIPIHTYRGTTIVSVQRQHKLSFYANIFYEIKLKPVIRAGDLTFELINAEPFPSAVPEKSLFSVTPPPKPAPPRYNPVLPMSFYIKNTPVYCTI